ncbi:MAG: leucine-rich repeat protein [Clostridia bacterium]|nr:leucine-rich repeat protein [Clostridia bacterium]
MTKRFLWVLCLMLALTLVAGAYAEGGNEGPVPELRAMEDVIIPIWDGADLNEDGFRPKRYIGGGDVLNYHEMVDAYGDCAVWSYRVLSGPDLGLGMNAPGNGNSWADLSLVSLPDSACEMTVELSVSWGGHTAVGTYTVTFVEVEPPMGVTVQDVVTLELGESRTLNFVHIPEDWHVPGEENSNYIVWAGDFREGLSYTSISETEYVFTGNIPGVYKGFLQIDKGHMMYFKPFTVQVTDENGNIPEPELSFQDWCLGEHTAILAPLDWEAEIHRENNLFEVFLDSDAYSELAPLYGAPEWTIEQSSGPDIDYNHAVDDYGDGPLLAVGLNSLPDDPCQAVFHVTCTMGPQTAEADITVNFIEIELPTGSTIPETVTLKAGESVTINGEFSTDNEYWNNPWFYCMDGYDESVLQIDRISDTELKLTGLQPGILNLAFAVNQDRVYAQRRVRIMITDENGDVPAPTMQLRGMTNGDEFTFYFWDGAEVVESEEGYGVFNEPFFSAVTVANQSEMYNYYGGVPSWSTETISGSVVTTHTPSWANSSYSYYGWLDSFPAQAGDTVLRVTCQWGDQTASHDVTLHFVKVTEPTGSTAPDEITLTKNKVEVFDDWKLLPDGALNDAERSSASIAASEANESYLDVKSTSPLKVKALKEGDIQGFVYVIRGNVIYKKAVTIHILPSEDEHVTETGACGPNATYTLTDDGVLTISGSGTVTSSDFSELTFTNLVIEEGITGLGDWVFSGCDGMTDVSLPVSLTSIGNFAFSGDGALNVTYAGTFEQWRGVSVGQDNGRLAHATIRCADQDWQDTVVCEVNDGVLTISGQGNLDALPYAQYVGFTEVEIGPGVWGGIGYSTFAWFGGITRFEVDAANPAYASRDGVLFTKDMTTLISYPDARGGHYTVPQGVKQIGWLAFCDAASLTEVTLPEGVEEIGLMSFSGCTSLNTVYLPQSLESVGNLAFGNCSALSDVYYAGSQAQWLNVQIDDENEPLTSCAFHFDWSGPEYEDFILPADLTVIEAEAFSGLGAEALHIVVPEGCQSIGDGAFANAADLLLVDVMGQDTAIAENAFSGCEEMKLNCLRGSAADTWAAGKAWVTVSYIGE